MSHPFGDLVSQHLHRKHGLSQSKLAEGILQAPTVITAMCKGRRLTGPQARERVVAIIRWLHAQGALDTLDEANVLFNAAGMSGLSEREVTQSNLRGLADARADSHKPRLDPGGFERKHNLPAPATSLIGREADVKTALDLLRRDGVRLVTLVGPPGVGKTRLALQVAWQARDEYADGTWFVPLATVDDPQHIAATIVQALDLPNVGAPPLLQLKNYLRDKQALLVLDNFEQLLDGAVTVAELLAAAPNLKILTTSRAALQLSSEHLFEVQPLAEPSAVELFVQRAQAIKPGFALSDGHAQAIAEICRRLDGLPLAIELAAARTKLFDPPQLLARLSSRLNLLTSHAQDLPARQRTLRGTIEWSYNLLSPEEQTLFRRLGIFAGGCSLEALECVAGDGLKTRVLDLVQSLADKRLIRANSQTDELRFSLLEMLREYAAECCEKSGELATMQRRHAEYFADYLDGVESAIGIQETSAWIGRLDRERDNLAAALTEARKIDDAVLQIRFVAAMSPMLVRLPELTGPAWLSELFARSEARTNLFTYAKALYGGAFLMGSDNVAIDAEWQAHLLQDAASIFESLGETVWQAATLARLGNVAWRQAMFALTERYCAHSARLFEGAGQKALAANALVWTAGAQRDQGKLVDAERLFKQCILSFDELHDEIGKGNAVNGLGELEYYRGDYDAANAYYDAAQATFSRTMWRELTQFGKGRVAYARGHTLEARRLLENCVDDARFWANAALLSMTLHHLASVKHLLSEDSQALSLLREAIVLQHGRKTHRVIAESLERFAWVAADTQQPQRAARLFGTADALRQWMGAPLPLGDKPLYDRYLEMAHAALDSDDFGQAWAEGAAMSLDQAVEYALTDK